MNKLTRDQVYLYLVCNAPKVPDDLWHRFLTQSPTVLAMHPEVSWYEKDASKLGALYDAAGAPTDPRFEQEPSSGRRRAYNMCHWGRTEAGRDVEAAKQVAILKWPTMFADEQIETVCERLGVKA